MRLPFIGRMFAGASFAINPSATASALAKHGAEKRRKAFTELRDEKLAAFRADIAAGRISQLGWKQ